MRTAEKLKELREVLTMRFGLMAYFMKDSDIESWGDALQGMYDTKKYHWDIRVKLRGDLEKFWGDISKEPTNPYATTQKIYDKGMNLLQKYPDIMQLRANITGDDDCHVIVTRHSYS